LEKQKIFITFSLDVHKKIDIVDKIEKEIKVKNCKICKQDKDLSEYSTTHKGKYYNSYCKNCKKQISKQHRINNPEYYKKYMEQYMPQYRQDNKEKFSQYFKQYHKDNKEQINQYSKQYYQDNKEQFSQYRNKINTSIPSGVYGIYEHAQLIYIGESGKPYSRIAIHFSNTTNPDNGSPIAHAIGNGELQRENLSYKMLEYIDDDSARKQQETVLIQRYQPKYNTLYVDA